MASLVCAIIGAVTSVFCFGLTGLVLGPVGFGLGLSSMHRIQASPGVRSGRGLAVAGMIIGVLAAAMGFVILLISIVQLSNSLIRVPAVTPSP